METCFFMEAQQHWSFVTMNALGEFEKKAPQTLDESDFNHFFCESARSQTNPGLCSGKTRCPDVALPKFYRLAKKKSVKNAFFHILRLLEERRP